MTQSKIKSIQWIMLLLWSLCWPPMMGKTQGDAPVASVAFRTSILSAEPKDFIDPFFAPQIVGNTTAAAIQPDGKILLSGKFTQINGLEAKDLVRFNHDGSIDPAFKFDHRVSNDGNAASILSILVLPDGKILIGGDFDRVDTFETSTIARLNSDGSLDVSLRASREQILALRDWGSTVRLDPDENGRFLASSLHFELLIDLGGMASIPATPRSARAGRFQGKALERPLYFRESTHPCVFYE